MKIVKTENETVIYPLLNESDTEQEEDYCIAVDRSGIMVDGYMWSNDEIRDVIARLEKCLELE